MNENKIKVYEINKPDVIYELLSRIVSNPYQDYNAFKKEIEHMIYQNKDQLTDFINLCNTIITDRQNQSNIHHIKNCVIDKIIPIFDPENPVDSKYEKKKTFIAEGFLLLFSICTKSPILGYETRNNGDMYQDVYSQSKYADTQTQKAAGDLYFHNDRTAHEIRADILCLLGMRVNPKNHSYTGYVDGTSLLENISKEYQQVLRGPYFTTPFDLYSSDSNALQENSGKHSILFNDHSFRYYDTRTTYATDINSPESTIAKEALLSLKDAIQLTKKHYIKINTSDLLCIPNQEGLHCRINIDISSEEDHKKRYLLKTYNFNSIESCSKYASSFFKNTAGLVKET